MKHLLNNIKSIIMVVVVFAVHPVYANPVENIVQLLNSGKNSEGLKQLSELANNGDADAQAMLGDIYAGGFLVPQNFSTAAKWRTLATEANHLYAMNALGKHYVKGYGVPVNLKLAEKYLTTAAESGDAEFQYDAGVFYDNEQNELYDAAKAASWFELAAAQGFVNAQANLGLLLYQGRGVSKDAKRAFTLLSSAARADHPAAQNNLGLLYVRGDGTEQDYKQAIYWFREAADNQHKSALTNLAVMYENGQGVEFDEQEARRLYKLAGQQAASNFSSTIAELKLIYDTRLVALNENTPLEQLKNNARGPDPVAHFQLAWHLATMQKTPDYQQALNEFRKAADAGLGAATLNIGILHMKGLGVPQDFISGYQLINEAAASGLPDAENIRSRILPFLTPDQLDRAQNLSVKAKVNAKR